MEPHRIAAHDRGRQEIFGPETEEAEMKTNTLSKGLDDGDSMVAEAGAAAQPLFLALELEDFAAQVLSAWDSAYRGKAYVVVDQDPDSHKTHVLACSRAARDLGLYAGMPLATVRRRYRNVGATFRNAVWETALCEELRAVCLDYTPEFSVRPNGQTLLDLTGTPAVRALGGRGVATLALRLQAEITRRTGLEEVAVGAASTRLLARVMARRAKGARGPEAPADGGPGRILVCPPGREAATLAPLTPDCLPGLSPQCREKIRRYALSSIGQIQRLGRPALAARFGGEGDKLHALACGLDLEEASSRRRGVMAETVLEEDINDDDELARKVRLTADKLVFHLRKEGVKAEKLVVAIRYSDHKAVRRTVALKPGTDDFAVLAALAQRMFAALYQRRVALRSILLCAPRAGMDTGQTDLFEDGRGRRQRALSDALVKIRGRSGFGAIVNAGGI
jgi:DNA polymerase-4